MSQLSVFVGAASVDAAVVEEEERMIEAASGGRQLLRVVVEEGQGKRAFGRGVDAAETQLTLGVGTPPEHYLGGEMLCDIFARGKSD